MSTAVERAAALVTKYQELSGEYYQEPDQTEVEDILADLRHYAHLKGVDWIKAVDMAELHFEEENEGDQDSLGG